MGSSMEAWRFWPWSTATAAGGGVAGFFVLLWLGDPARTAGGLVAATMNGVVLFFLVGGIFAAFRAAEQRSRSLADHPWRFALAPAVAALVVLLALRMTALALRLDGPWRTVPDSLLDVGGRSLVVFVVIAAVAGRSGRRRRPSPYR
ncbi:hypothetical protein ACFP2T_23465 [Plantactinospora solaniradicis]|uniref:Uncharacterized protein n=1 Tax=Plantactinospora solaniradicis TaxID=1723736 RepID=A0ABW1KC93_9ACTN